jgi:hypothetical protein
MQPLEIAIANIGTFPINSLNKMQMADPNNSKNKDVKWPFFII